MRSSESVQHKRIKEIICNKLKEWAGAAIKEYQSSGHYLDVFAVTPLGVTIYVEVIWSSSKGNFFRDLSMIQSSNANVKLIVVSPKILNNEKFQREFEKVAISQQRYNVAMHGEFIDGERILNDSDYVETELKQCIMKLIQKVKIRGKVVGVQARFEPPQPRHPDKIQEMLLSNLFPLINYPTEMFVSPTSIKRRSSFYAKFGGKIDSYSFLPKNNNLYTFDDLRNPDSPFRTAISTNKISVEKTSDWIVSSAKRDDLIDLFNQALRKYCRTRGLNFDRRHHRFVCSLKDGGPRLFTWRTERGGRSIPRVMAKLMKGLDGNVLFGKHYAARLRFIIFDESIFLRIAPTMTFTSDGYKPIRSKKLASLMSRYLSKQYNNTYLDSVRYWGKFLSKLDTKISIPTGGPPIEVDSTPISIKVNVGIAREGELQN